MIADVHGGADPASDDALRALLTRAPGAGVDVLLLGDLFVAWLGPSRFWTRPQKALLEGIQQVRRSGVWVGFVVGNRDYLVEEALEGTVFDVVWSGETLAPLGGMMTLIAHGDLTNDEDYAYRRWHRLSRSPLISRLLGRVPGPVGQRLARFVERSMRRSNRAMKAGHLPLAGLEAMGRRAARLGAERALVGHFHVERTLSVGGGSPVHIAPAWCESQRYLCIGTDGRMVSETWRGADDADATNATAARPGRVEDR